MFPALVAIACNGAPESGFVVDARGHDGDAAADSYQVGLDLAAPDVLEPDVTDDPQPTVTLTLQVQSYGAAFLAPNWVRGRTSWGFPHYQSVDRELRDDATAPSPVPGARVALDGADGSRLGEALSDADGHVVFEVTGDPWPVNATAYKAGYPLHTLAAIDRPTNDAPIVVTMSSPWREPRDMVRIQGATRRRHWETSVYINLLPPYADWSSRQANDWSLELPLGAPLELFVVETGWQEHAEGWAQPPVQMAYAAHEGLDIDAPLSVSFSDDGVSWQLITGTFGLPSRAGSPLRQGLVEPAARVLAQRGSVWSGVVGWPTLVLRDGRIVDYEIALADIPGNNGTWYDYWMDSNAGWSMAWGRGNSAGPQPTLLDLPSWISESRSGLGFPVDEPLSWALYDEAVSPRLLIRNDVEVRWVVEFPEDATQVVLPAPPSEADHAELLGPAPTATVVLERPIDSEEGVFWMASWGSRLRLDLTAWQEGTR